MFRSKVIDKFFYILGFEIRIRILPEEFRKDIKNISTLGDDRKFAEADKAIKNAYKRWGSDEDIVRLDYLLNDEL